MRKKRPKVRCEICGETNIAVLERHHIVPRTELNCTHDDFNIAILCGNCHTKHHAGMIKIIGVFPSTDPSGVSLIYEENGQKNVDIEEPYYVPKLKKMKVYYGREKVKATECESKTDSDE